MTDRTVAIKALPAQFSDDPIFQHRFRREAHATARLNSPHVIPIHDYGEIDGRLFVAMRLVEGHDLEAVLNDGPLAPQRAVRIIERMGGSVDDARADIYALACVLYECLTGQPPFSGTNMASLVAAHLNSPAPRP